MSDKKYYVKLRGVSDLDGFQEVLVRIDATNGLIDNLKTSIETRIDATNQRIDVTNDRIDKLKTSLDLDKRVERLETRQTH
jgi:hypothetical protein